MAKKKTRDANEASSQRAEAAPVPVKPDETLFEAVASICSVLVVGLYILTFLAQNYVIPSGSMEKTLLIGDHLVVDRISLAPSAKWMPLEHYREPRHGDIVVFIKPVAEPQPDADGNPQYFILVKRLIGVPGDRIHLHNGIVSINGVAQAPPKDGSDDPGSSIDQQYLDEFPSIPPAQAPSGAETASWADDAPNHIVDGDLVVPPGMYFMMGDNRHNSLDSRYWGFVPRQNIVGRPLFNYWSFKSTEEDYSQTEVSRNIAWMVHVVTHFLSDTRWSRT
ncbi:MAG: signal peptidase I, partial [Terracidiphilus sp.]|nr:signal peptidase I [Terracidiphilus sp.]